MLPGLFDALAPVCPRCLQGGAGEATLRVAEVAETRAGRIWHGILHCTSAACWAEYPVIDGVPVIVANPAEFLSNARAQVLARDDLPAPLQGLIGDALGPGGEYDTTRQHLSIYADAHYGDWTEGRSDTAPPPTPRHSRADPAPRHSRADPAPRHSHEGGNLVPAQGDPRLRGDDGASTAGDCRPVGDDGAGGEGEPHLHGTGGAGGAGDPRLRGDDGTHDAPRAGDTPDIVAALGAGLDALGSVEGPAVDLGGAVGRAGWELARRLAPVLVTDLNFSFLRFAQKLALEGEAVFGRRRVGLVYRPATVRLPAGLDGSALDFWAADAMALPFPPATFRLATAINLVDSIAGPTEAVAEAARILAPGGGAVFATPHDWTQNAAEPARWMGGHSQRAPHGGAAEPVLRATLAAHGLDAIAEHTGLAWRLPLHDRAVMHYDLHLVACRRAG